MPTDGGGPLHWAGFAQRGAYYRAGAMVVFKDGTVNISRVDHNRLDEPHTWVRAGRLGASPTVVVHKWNPQEARYPVGFTDQMSEAVAVCHDCWKDADFKNAFDAKAHLYVIRELGL